MRLCGAGLSDGVRVPLMDVVRDRVAVTVWDEDAEALRLGLV